LLLLFGITSADNRKALIYVKNIFVVNGILLRLEPFVWAAKTVIRYANSFDATFEKCLEAKEAKEVILNYY
jgi:hypothetical protein